jgi:arylsulfatase A-like enzyme
VCQIDLLASLAVLTGQNLNSDAAPDSAAILPAIVGESRKGRDVLVEQGVTFALRQAEWKYIVPSSAPPKNRNTGTETGASPQPQLYNLADDLGETRNLAESNPAKVKELSELLDRIRAGQRSEPVPQN